MDSEVMARLRALLDATRVLSLGVIVDGEPEVGLLPYACAADRTALYVQASGLARHSRGMQSGAPVAVLVHAADTPDGDPLQVSRLSVPATVRLLPRESDDFASAARRFVSRFPTAAMTLQLGDFNLYELRLGRGRYVEGFARAFNVGPDTFATL